MTLNASGPLSIGGTTTGQSINLELGLAQNATSGLGDTNFRTLAGVATGAISMSNFYGKSNIVLKGYWPGGFTNSSTTTTTIQSINFSSEAMVAVSATTGDSAGSWSSVFNSTNCYFAGGQDNSGGNFNTWRKFVFSNEVRTTLAATESQYTQPGAVSNQVTYGYLLSGQGPYGPDTGRARFTFSSETSLTQSGTFNAWGFGNECVSTSTTGYSRPTTGPVATMTFSTETMGTISATLAASVTDAAGASSSTVGYSFAGWTTVIISATAAWTFSTGAAKTVSAVVSTARHDLGSPQSSTKAYIGGGIIFGGSMSSVINGFLFSTETMATQSATMSPAVGYIQGFQNGGVL
jgi:hypothetical protein